MFRNVSLSGLSDDPRTGLSDDPSWGRTPSWVDEHSGLALPTVTPRVPEFQNTARRDYIKTLRRGKVEMRLTDLRQMFQKYDANGDGILDKDEMHQLLRELAGGLPTLYDEEIDYVMRAADDNHNGVIDEEELPRAVQLWDGYLEHKDEIETVMQRYDTNKDGRLSREELGAMLHDLEGGKRYISGLEIDTVMRAADVSNTGWLTPREAVFAISYFYSFDERPSPMVQPPIQQSSQPAMPNSSAPNVTSFGAPDLPADQINEVTRLFVLHKAGGLTESEYWAAVAIVQKKKADAEV